MKKFILNTIILIGCINSNAQNWLINGNSNLTSSNFLGSTNNRAVAFKANNIECGRIEPNATWRFGNNLNNIKIDSTGKLTFSGNGAYSVGSNKYIFRYSGDAVKGFYLSSTQDQYQFLNANGTAIFYVNGDNGNSGVLGTFKIGAYTLPASDGNKNQVLKTNGAGNLTWKADSSTIYVAGSGISISGDTIAATQWTTKGNKIYYNSGDVGIGVTSPAYKLDVKGDINLSAGNVLRSSNNILLKYDTAKNSVWFGTGNAVNNEGDGNIAIGKNALYKNDSGFENIAVGNGALQNNDSGYFAVAVGDSALYNEKGYTPANTAIGYKALYYNTTGNINTALGAFALYNNTTGNQNNAIGVNALIDNANGSYNTALGYVALSTNISGSYNTAVGDYALDGLGTGDFNSAFGAQAIVNNNLSNGTAIGYGTFVTGSNGTAIGSGAFVTASNQVRIGGSDVTSIGGAVNWSIASDGRIKKNIKQNVPGLLFINKLQPVTYNLDLDAADKIIQRPTIKNKDGKIIQPTQQQIDARKAKQQIVYTGFIAQDVEKAAKSLNYDFSGVDAAKNNHDLYGLRYAEFVVPLVKAVQELSNQNDSLKKFYDKKLNEQQQEIDELKAMIVSNNTALQSTANNQLPVLSPASISQNIPNPFSNSTTISYTLPQQYSSAKIIITDKNGNTLKQINLTNTNKGSIMVDASTLASGAYQYSLIVDGKMIGTKQMEMIR